MVKLPKHLRRPSLVIIRQAEESGNTQLAKILWAQRDNMSTRYANQSIRSQRQRRKQARRLQQF